MRIIFVFFLFRCRCDICRKGFLSSNRYKEHQLKHEGLSFKCQVCGKTYSTADKLKYHESDHTGIYRWAAPHTLYKDLKIFVVIPKEDLGNGWCKPNQAFFWYDANYRIVPCCLIFFRIKVQRYLMLMWLLLMSILFIFHGRCHIERRLGWADPGQAFF